MQTDVEFLGKVLGVKGIQDLFFVLTGAALEIGNPGKRFSGIDIGGVIVMFHKGVKAIDEHKLLVFWAFGINDALHRESVIPKGSNACKFLISKVIALEIGKCGIHFDTGAVCIKSVQFPGIDNDCGIDLG